MVFSCRNNISFHWKSCLEYAGWLSSLSLFYSSLNFFAFDIFLVKNPSPQVKMSIFSVVFWTNPGTPNRKNGEPIFSDLILVVGSQDQWRSRRSIQNSVLSVLLQTEKDALSLIFCGFIRGSSLGVVEHFLLYKNVWLVSLHLSCWRRNKPKTSSWICFLMKNNWQFYSQWQGEKESMLKKHAKKSRASKKTIDCLMSLEKNTISSSTEQDTIPAKHHFWIPIQLLS